MFEVRLSGPAEQDLLDGRSFYESQSEGLGSYFLDNLMGDLRALSLFGGIHAKPLCGFHRALSKRFPFAIYYDFDGSTVTVAAILDCRRDPRSIHRRVALRKPSGMTEFPRQSVDSTAIRSIGYEASSRTLEVEFASGSVYRYFGVPEHVYERFAEATSKGRFFSTEIRDIYRFVAL